jgi:hypothetical protein
LAAIEKSRQRPGDFLGRYVDGDWGEIPLQDLSVILFGSGNAHSATKFAVLTIPFSLRIDGTALLT